ncbi:MAG: nuclear transport factor 2 family protein [Litorimonas sp.]
MINLPKVIETYIRAYNNFDVTGMLDCLANDVVFQNYTGDDITAQANSKDEFENMAKMGASAFEKRKQTPLHAITVGNTTHIEIEYFATVATDLPNGWKAGQELSFKGTSAYAIEENKIIKLIDAA